MINYSNVAAITRGSGNKHGYGFFDGILGGGNSGGGLSKKEHDRRLGLREEAYEMRRQREQARKVDHLKMSHDLAHADRRREAGAKLNDDIARARAMHAVQLELNQSAHHQQLGFRADTHKQQLVHDRANANNKLTATKALDAHKLDHEVTRVQTMHGAGQQIAAERHKLELTHRAERHQQDQGHRDEVHAQRLGHFRDQVAAGMKRKATTPQAITPPASTPQGSKPNAPSSTPQAAQSQGSQAQSTPTPAEPISVPHVSLKGKPRKSAPSTPADHGQAEYTPAQKSRLSSAVDDIGAAMSGTLRGRSSHTPRPKAAPATMPTPASADAPIRKPKAAPRAPQPTASPASKPAAAKPLSTSLPSARTSVTVSGVHEHVDARAPWDKRGFSERLATQKPGMRVETSEESTARLRLRKKA